HRLQDPDELPRVDEAEPAPAGTDGELEAERVDVEEEAVRSQCPVDVAQDVHDVLGVNSSERPGEERRVELCGRQLDLGCVGDLEADPVAESTGRRAPRL